MKNEAINGKSLQYIFFPVLICSVLREWECFAPEPNPTDIGWHCCHPRLLDTTVGWHIPLVPKAMWKGWQGPWPWQSPTMATALLNPLLKLPGTHIELCSPAPRQRAAL